MLQPAGRGVVHVSSQFPPHSNGGLGTHVQALCTALAPQIPVAVLVPAEPRYTTLPGVRYWLQSGNPLDIGAGEAWGRTLVQALEALTGASGRRPIIHAHNYEVALPALYARVETGAPLVVTLHLPAPPAFAALERKLVEHADAVIAVSSSLSEEYTSRDWNGVRPVAIPNGVDSTVFHGPGSVPSLRSPTRLLIAGRVTPQKGIDLAIRALASLLPRFPQLELRVAGTGPWERAYRNLARELGVQDRVTWLGFLGQDALRREYQECSMLLMPSRFEPFGLSALEAMACGAPVIASWVGGLPEFITPDESGLLVPPSDVGALAEAIRYLLAFPEEAAWLGAGAVTAARSLSWDRTARSTLEVYRSLPVRGTC